MKKGAGEPNTVKSYEKSEHTAMLLNNRFNRISYKYRPGWKTLSNTSEVIKIPHSLFLNLLKRCKEKMFNVSENIHATHLTYIFPFFSRTVSSEKNKTKHFNEKE